MKLYFFDTETTGTDEEAKIVQFAGKLVDTKLPDNSDDFYEEFFDPEKPIEIGAMAIHHITEEMVKGKRKFAEARSSIDDIFQNTISIAHNATFDVARVVFEGMNKPKYVIDTLRVARTLLQELDEVPEAYNMQYLRYWLGLEFTEEIVAHDAKGDVIVLEALFNFLANMMIGNHENQKAVINEMVRISLNPVFLKIFPLGKHKGEKTVDVPTIYLQWAVVNMTEVGEDITFTISEELKNR